MPGDICPEVPAQSVQEVLKWNASAIVRKNGIHSNDSPTFQSKEPLHLKIRDHPTVDLGDISSNEKELLLEAAPVCHLASGAWVQILVLPATCFNFYPVREARE